MATSDIEISAVFRAFGGATKLARAIKCPITTVHSWKRNNRIPAWRWPLILAAAERDDVTLPKCGAV